MTFELQRCQDVELIVRSKVRVPLNCRLGAALLLCENMSYAHY